MLQQHPTESRRDFLDRLVDEDPIQLRDEAFKLVTALEHIQELVIMGVAAKAKWMGFYGVNQCLSEVDLGVGGFQDPSEGIEPGEWREA